MGRAPFVVAVGAVALAGLVGCSDDDAAPGPSLELRDRIAYAVSDTPQDRASGAVESALGRLDACALIDPAGAGVAGFAESAELEARSPHSCTVRNNAYDNVSVTLGVELSPDDRFANKLTSLGGARAYVLASTTKTLCRVALPVSFTHAIGFFASTSGTDRQACAPAKDFAATAAERLATPESVEFDRNRARQTACAILRRAVDLDRGTEIRYGTDFDAGMDRCGVWESGPQGDESEIEPAAPTSYLSIEYGESAADYYDDSFGTISGRRIHGEDSAECTLAWDEWKPASAADAAVARFQVSAPSCTKSKRLVTDIVEVIDRGEAESSREPQRPVLYEPGEADSAAVGACADVKESEEIDCTPYAEADAPSTGEQTIKAAEADPNVNCAIAIDAVHEHFGSDMSPVTARYSGETHGDAKYACGFVEESHALQVWFVASPDPMNQTPDSEMDGHPVHDLTTASQGMRQMWIALDEPDESGHLYAELRVLPSPDHGMYADAPVNEKPLEELDETTSEIVSEHFSAE